MAGRFDRPLPPEDMSREQLARIEAELGRLAEALAALDVRPVVNVPPHPMMEVPAPIVPMEGFVEALARVEERLTEIVRTAPEITVQGPEGPSTAVLSDGALTPLVEQAQRQQEILDALREKISSMSGGQRAIFDGRIRTADSKHIDASNPLPVALESGGDGELPLAVYDRFADSSLTGEQTVSSWFPEIVGSFSTELPSTVSEVTNDDGGGGTITPSFANGQMSVTVPPGGSYTIITSQQVHYTNGQETRALYTRFFDTAPAAGVTAIFWMLSKDQMSGWGSGHHNGEWVYARRFAGVTTYINEAEFSNAESIDHEDGTVVTPRRASRQIERLRMLYLGYGPLIGEYRNRQIVGRPIWRTQHVEHFVNNDDADGLPNLSEPHLGWAMEIVNAGVADCTVRTQSFGIGPVLGDPGERQPDGDRIYPVADGIATNVDGDAVESTELLLANETWDSGWFDTDGWNQSELLIQCDQTSASGGIQVDYTNNTQGLPSPPVRRTVYYTFTAADVTNGSAVIPLSVTSDGARIRYTNGGTNQGAFYIGVTMRRPARPLDQRALTGTIESTDSGAIVQSVIFGPDPAIPSPPTYRRASVTADGELQVTHPDNVHIKSLDSVSGNAITSLGTTAVAVASAPPENTRSFSFIASSVNSKAIYLGTTSAVSASNAMWELGAGASVTFPVEAAQTFYAVAAGAGQALRWVYGVRADAT